MSFQPSKASLGQPKSITTDAVKVASKTSQVRHLQAKSRSTLLPVALHVDAAARRSLTSSILFVLLCLLCALSLLSQTISALTVYDQTKLLSIKDSCQDNAFGNYDYIPTEILHSPQLAGVGIIQTERRHRWQRGRRAGLRVRLQANPHKSP